MNTPTVGKVDSRLKFYYKNRSRDLPQPNTSSKNFLGALSIGLSLINKCSRFPPPYLDLAS